ncbi:DJ-1/PfpI family protein [Myxococcus faecalis]|uniref:DJ-1/PfpI family protein n=1 Tax=Myxococcus faecalis TaxID=3115646 RepID=UPI003CEE2B7F
MLPALWLASAAIAAEPTAPQARPKLPISVAFVLAAGAEVVDFTGPWGVFEYVTVPGGSGSPYKLFTVADATRPLKVSGGLTVVPDFSFANAPMPDVVVVPAIEGNPSPAMLAWLKKVGARAELTMSVCTGAFVLAAAGILDGKQATTHHSALGLLAANHPTIAVKRGARFVDSGKVATAGGLTSGIDLALHVVGRTFGREVAEATAKQLEYQGTGWKDPASNAAFAKRPVSTAEHPLCPVCEMEVDPKRAPSLDHEGQHYGFCSEGCKTAFQKAPKFFEW